jgi:hypothetical protein
MRIHHKLFAALLVLSPFAFIGCDTVIAPVFDCVATLGNEFVRLFAPCDCLCRCTASMQCVDGHEQQEPTCADKCAVLGFHSGQICEPAPRGLNGC